MHDLHLTNERQPLLEIVVGQVIIKHVLVLENVQPLHGLCQQLLGLDRLFRVLVVVVENEGKARFKDKDRAESQRVVGQGQEILLLGASVVEQDLARLFALVFQFEAEVLDVVLAEELLWVHLHHRDRVLLNLHVLINRVRTSQ